MKTRKLVACALFSLLVLVSFSGCGQSAADGQDADDSAMRIVCTIFPQYDWTRNILGNLADQTELTLLLDNGVDLHSYQPTAEDIVTISRANVFIYVGGASDAQFDEVLASASNEDMLVLDLMDILADALKQEEVVAGMQAHEEEDHGDTEYDEHVWLSLHNARQCCQAICDALSQHDPEHAAAYQDNLDGYLAQLDALDDEFARQLGAAERRTILMGDRFPFRYLVDDYGLEYYAAFAGCSAESEASFETITFLAGKVDELGLPVVLALDGSDQSIAQTIVDNTQGKDQQILALDSMQSITASAIAQGVDYLSVMQANLQVLVTALN